MFFSNWGIVRGDIYRGAFTLGDFCKPDLALSFFGINVCVHQIRSAPTIKTYTNM